MALGVVWIVGMKPDFAIPECIHTLQNMLIVYIAEQVGMEFLFMYFHLSKEALHSSL